MGSKKMQEVFISLMDDFFKKRKGAGVYTGDGTKPTISKEEREAVLRLFANMNAKDRRLIKICMMAHKVMVTVGVLRSSLCIR